MHQKVGVGAWLEVTWERRAWRRVHEMARMVEGSTAQVIRWPATWWWLCGMVWFEFQPTEIDG